MSHPAVVSSVEPCPSCQKEVKAEFIRSGHTREGQPVQWEDFWCRECRTKWVSISEIGLVRKIK